MERMGSILEYAREDTVFGVDTETYNDNGHYGLKSIQVWNPSESHYFTADTFDDSDESIRSGICKKFFDWLGNGDGGRTLVFFNMDFDFSQMA